MTTPYKSLGTAELSTLLEELQNKYNHYIEKHLTLDMSRGKPNSEQLDLSLALLDMVNSEKGFCSESGVDCRNYGVLLGLPEARKLMAGLLEVQPDEVMVGGNSSLNLMFDAVSRAMILGVYGSDKPWCKEEEIKFLCPSPGYDRHFAICQHFGIKMIPIAMTDEGPDMDEVAFHVERDPSIKGIWCVPKYSNPTGITYSPRVVERFAELNPAARDFRIFWDNAYAIHGFYEQDDQLVNLFDLLKQRGKENMLFIFGSTSKISFAGAGLAAMGASRANIALTEKQLSIQTIGYDKLSQLMHVRYFKDFDGMRNHMKKHGTLLRPKFEMIDTILTEQLDGLEIADWTKPRGGYFISLDTLENCAKRTVELCDRAGVKLTPAGATYPYGIDPKDTNIRIAPSFPTVEELRTATELLCLAVKIASVEYYLTISI